MPNSDNDGFGTMEGEADVALCSNSNVELFEGFPQTIVIVTTTIVPPIRRLHEDCAEVDRNCDELPDLGAIDQSDGTSIQMGIPMVMKTFILYLQQEPAWILYFLLKMVVQTNMTVMISMDKHFLKHLNTAMEKLEDCDRVGEDGLRTEPWFLDDAEDVLAFEEAIANGENSNMVLRYIPADEWDDDGDNTVECDLDINPIVWSSSQNKRCGWSNDWIDRWIGLR